MPFKQNRLVVFGEAEIAVICFTNPTRQRGRAFYETSVSWCGEAFALADASG